MENLLFTTQSGRLTNLSTGYGDYNRKEHNIEDTQSYKDSKLFWSSNTCDLITVEQMISNPLKTLIDIKKRIRMLPTNGKVQNTLHRQQIIKMIESYDDGFISSNDNVIPVIKNIISELVINHYLYDKMPIMSFIFDNPDYAIQYAK